jgi:very-short-patch-repair endonuclease
MYAQLRDAGLTRDAIAHRVTHGRLTRLHRGVYLAGPIASPLTHSLAALLACGPDAALSHHTAAAMWELVAPRPGPIHVTVRSGRPRHDGVRAHRASLRPSEVATREGLTLTTPARTLVDLAALVPRRETARAMEAAIVRGLTTHDDLLAEIHAAGRRRGAGALRASLAELEAPSLTRSEAERRLLALVRKAGLPHPVTNARLGRYEVDMLWPRERIVVEVDGYTFHSGRQAFERDRRRDVDLQLAGHRVLRITWRQIVREPHRVTATLGAALSRGSGS